MKRVTFEQAKRLKDLGYPKHFDWIYSVADRTDLPPTQHWGEIENYQPTLHEVCDWLREEKGIHVDVYADYSITSKDIGGDYNVDEITSIDGYELEVVAIGMLENARYFSTYHEAQSTGIDKALEILEKKI